MHRGFPVLVFDLRGSGESEGTLFTVGAHEVRDIGGALDFVSERGLMDDGVNLLGYSMGGATALIGAADEPLVRAVAIDSSYADLNSVLDFRVAQRELGLHFFKPGAMLISRILLGVIHGQADTVVPFEHSRRLAAAYGPGVEKYFLADAGRRRAYESDPESYMLQLLEFFRGEP